MKVLQLGKFFPVRGGVEKVALSLTEGLSSRGIDCDMLCTYASRTLSSYSYQAGPCHSRVIPLNPHGRIICVRSHLTLAQTTLSLHLLHYLRRHAREYDLIHIHHPDPMAAFALLASGYRGRVILHWHSDILSQKLALALFKPFQSWLIRRAETIVGTTPVYLTHSPFLRKVQEKCRCIPIGIVPLRPDAGRVRSLRRKYAPDGTKLILSIGRLVPYKGFEYLIDAMNRLDGSYRLVIGGMGPLLPDLQQRIVRLGLQDRITMAGYVGKSDLPDWFGACDLFVLSSVMKTEAFGIVQLEAFSCGKPVITSAIEGSGVSWVNRDGVSGINVPTADSDAIAAAVRTVCEDRNLYEQFSKGALERYESCFTHKKMIDETLRLYENQQQ